MEILLIVLLVMIFANVPIVEDFTVPSLIVAVTGIAISIGIGLTMRQNDKLIEAQKEHIALNDQVIEQQAEVISKLMILRQAGQQEKQSGRPQG